MKEAKMGNLYLCDPEKNHSCKGYKRPGWCGIECFCTTKKEKSLTGKPLKAGEYEQEEKRRAAGLKVALLQPGRQRERLSEKAYKDIALQYAQDVVAGKIIAGAEIVLACQRYLDDLKRPDLELRTKDLDLFINIMQGTLVHAQGEEINGEPLQGKPFLLEPWQIFMVYNLLGFYYKGTNERRYKEAWSKLKVAPVQPGREHERLSEKAHKIHPAGCGLQPNDLDNP